MGSQRTSDWFYNSRQAEGDPKQLVFFAVFYFIAVIIVSHFFVPPEYYWLQHTISDLGAQGLQYQWIMQLGFIGFGLLLNIGLVMKFVAAKKIFYPDVLLANRKYRKDRQSDLRRGAVSRT